MDIGPKFLRTRNARLGALDAIISMGVGMGDGAGFGWAPPLRNSGTTLPQWRQRDSSVVRYRPPFDADMEPWAQRMRTAKPQMAPIVPPKDRRALTVQRCACLPWLYFSRFFLLPLYIISSPPIRPVYQILDTPYREPSHSRRYLSNWRYLAAPCLDA